MQETGYTKLFSTIITSTVWAEDAETKVIWITLLALSNKYGEVPATEPGVARAAGVSLEKAEQVLKKFQEPDKYSRSSEFEGRRIKRINGGYLILNYAAYRAKMQPEERREYLRKKQAEHRAKDKASTRSQLNVDESTLSTQAEAEAKAEAEAILTDKTARKHFIPPSIEDIKAYIKENPELNNIDAVDFFKGYNDAGWIDTQGKPVRNWKLKLRTRSKYANTERPSANRGDIKKGAPTSFIR